MMSTFAPALQAHLESLPNPGILERRALRICTAPDSPHRTRLLERWEAGSREKLGFDPSSIIDWFKQNWKTILQVVLSILGVLLMFAEPPEAGVMMADPEAVGWFPGKNLLLSIMPQIIDQIVIGWAREAASRLPIPINYNDADLKAFLMDTLTKSQS